MPIYLVPDHVRVREEDFGLLFYDARSTRLTFVRSTDRLAAPPFVAEARELRLTRPTPPDAALSRALADLVEKGLLIALPSE